MPSEILNLGFQSLSITGPIAENLLITGTPGMAWESPKIHPKLFWGGVQHTFQNNSNRDG